MDLIAYVQGPYGRVEDERTDRDLEVEGELPADLAGVFVQNHANPRFEPMGFYHWFDGDGMVHGVEIAGGKATYRNRYIRTAAFEAESAAGKVLAPGILGPLGPLDGAAPLDKDTANTDVTFFQGGLFATWWLSGEPMRLSLPDLDTVGVERFGAPPGLRVAAHPKVDPRRGELVFIDYDVYGRRPLRTGVIGADGRLLRLHEVPGARPTLYHDIAITEHHTVIPDLPMAYNPAKLAQGKRRPEFLRDAPARFAVVHRDTGAVRWFEASPCYSYHTVNAWEETDARGRWITMVGCRYMPVTRPDGSIDEQRTAKDIAELVMHARLWRWRMNLDTGATEEQCLDAGHNLEFPSYNSALTGRRTRYGYFVDHSDDVILQWAGLRKCDLDTGATLSAWRDDPTQSWYSEPWFAAADHPQSEDHGYVIAFQWNAAEQRQTLDIFDARDLGQGPVAQVLIPRHIPTGFHGCWFAASRLKPRF